MPIEWRRVTLADAAAIGGFRQPLDDQDGDAADDQGPGHDDRIAEQKLDIVADRKADHHCRNERHEQVAHEPPCVRRSVEHSDQHLPEGPPVEDDDGEDGARLDGDVEHRPFVRLEAQQLGGEDQVAGRRDRQIFGDPLDDAEDDDEKEDRHRAVWV